MAIPAEPTTFTKDIQGRYLCNEINEVNAWQSGGGRPFDFIIVGGGTFGAAIAEHLWFRQKQSGGGLRTPVVEAGPFTVPEHVQNTGLRDFGDPAQLLGLKSTGGLSPDDLLNLLKLEAPLAVQAKPPHAGFFPMNKFSTVPLLLKAARQAFADFGTDDARKDFMLLPNTHVLSLRTTKTGGGTWRVTGV